MRTNKSSSQCAASLLVLTLCLFVLPSAMAGARFKTIFKFPDFWKDGANPYSGLIFDQQGNLYGTAATGGEFGWGAVFQLVPQSDGTWTENVLYSFNPDKDGGDGVTPFAGLIFDNAGNLYGTTYGGGGSNKCDGGCGTVFELTPSSNGSWTENILYGFAGPGGAMPNSGLALDQAGNLYGSTLLGGPSNNGVAFELIPAGNGKWNEKLLHTFSGGSDGAFPAAGLILDQEGNLYGTASGGGNGKHGLAFKLTPNPKGSWKMKVLYAFTGYSNGAGPYSSLTFDSRGNLYGTTLSGGDTQKYVFGFGVVFQLTPKSRGIWNERVLYAFTGATDGNTPYSDVIFDSAGNLYGTTKFGGDAQCPNKGCGVVFELIPRPKGEWKETVLHTFVYHPGASPYGNLTFDASGNLFGTTEGYSKSGSVWEIMALPR